MINEEREKYRAKNKSLRNTSTNPKGAAFVILINHASAPIRKERLSQQAKQGGRPAEMSLWKKGEVPDRLKSFGEIDSREDRSRAQSGFVKSI